MLTAVSSPCRLVNLSINYSGLFLKFYCEFLLAAPAFILVAQFRGITKLDLSFSSLSDTTSTNTFAEYIKRDQALRSLNLNCCRLLNGESTAYLLRSIGGTSHLHVHSSYFAWLTWRYHNNCAMLAIVTLVLGNDCAEVILVASYYYTAQCFHHSIIS